MTAMSFVPVPPRPSAPSDRRRKVPSRKSPVYCEKKPGQSVTPPPKLSRELTRKQQQAFDRRRAGPLISCAMNDLLYCLRGAVACALAGTWAWVIGTGVGWYLAVTLRDARLL